MKPSGLSRVLIALGGASPSRPALETGVGLAAAIGAALDALFVEDASLLRLGALPFASETSALTGARRALGAGEMERALRVEAAQLERLLAQAAARRQVPWSFAVTRGQLLTEAMRRDADLIVFGAQTHATPPVNEPEPSGPVTAVFDASPEALRTLAATTQLARALTRSLLILVPPEKRAPQRAAHQQARDWLQAEQVAGLVVTMDSGERALVGAVRARRSGLLALPASVLDLWPVELAALVAGIACPLVIVR